MPKIIEGAKTKILDAYKEDVKEYGYSKISVRSIAKRSGIGVGTIYHYFKDKQDITIAVLLEDWFSLYYEESKRVENTASFNDGILIIYELIKTYWSTHKDVFSKLDVKDFAFNYEKERPVFTSQIKTLLDSLFNKFEVNSDEQTKIIISRIIIDGVIDEQININKIIEIINKIL